ncbi:MAG: nickel-dependent lactate racemase [Clostridia bacterium]|nr:nickel-dependent lactate racemase [Clostridia bacterium]
MEIVLDYGKKGLKIDLDNADVFYPSPQKAIENPVEAIRSKLHAPDFGPTLKEFFKGKKTVAIAHTDITRATPNTIIIPLLIEELLAAGARKEDITLVNMTGSHRPQTQAELEGMLTAEVARNYKCVQHNSFDYSTMTEAGTFGDGNTLYINKEFMDADLKICTGFIEPHFFAGFSGGPKAILPGLSDIESIMRNHNAARIASPLATWGITEGNPVWENIREGARIVNPDLLINVAMDTKNCISGVFVGKWEETHRKGYEFVKRHAMQKVEKEYDIVITTNSGYPLDMNLYQCVKGISTAAQIVKEGGVIIMAGECSDGIPDNSHYHNILKMKNTPEDLFRFIMENETTMPEQWQAQIQTRIQKRAKVYVYSSLSDDKIKEAMFFPCKDIEKLVANLKGSAAVLPKGPQTIPYIERSADKS